jgi:hypothetical protein
MLRPEGAGATGDIAWQSWGRFGRTIARRCRQADAVVAISPAVRAELLAGVGAAVDAVGGSFTMRYTAVVVTAVRR